MRKILYLLLLVGAPCLLFAQPCSIFLSQVGNQQCDDNGTPGDPSDDTWTFILSIAASAGEGSGWVASDPLSTTGTYGSVVTMGPYPITSGTLPIFATDLDDPNCTTITVQVVPPDPCSNAQACNITDPGIGSISCDDFGSANPNDDFTVIELNPTGVGLGSFYNVTSLFTSPSPGFANYGVSTAQSLFPATAANPQITLNIIDGDDPSCVLTFTIDNPCFVPSTCNITDPGVGSITCDQFGSPTAPGDDFAVVELNPVGTGLGATYIVTSPVASASPGFGTYGTPSFQSFFGSAVAGPTIPITITDSDDPNCSITFDVPNPSPCATIVCDLSVIESGPAICNNAGTPADPSDDFFSQDLTVSNGGSTGFWTANDPGNAAGNYDFSQIFGPYLAANGDVTFTITDSGDPSCNIDYTIVNPCTTSCDLTNPGLGFTECNDNGTPGDPSDDFYTFPLNPVGSGLGSGYTVSVSAGTLSPSGGFYGSPTTFSISGAAPGTGISIIVTDNDDPNCTTNTIINLPPGCATLPCNIQDAGLANVTCNDAGTPANSADDFIQFNLNPTGTNLGTQYQVTSSSGFITPNLSVYGSPSTFQTNPGTPGSGDITLTITDVDDPSCSFTIVLPDPGACDIPCTLGPAPQGTSCNDNGTPNNPNDDVFTVDILVTGAGSGWQANDPANTTGSFNDLASFGPFPISGGPVIIVFTSLDDPTCQSSVQISPPSPCSIPCDLLANAATPSCNDNGTANNPNDDTFTVDITVTGTGSGWQANDPSNTSGTYGQTVTFGPFPISSGPVALTFSAQDDPTCQDVAIIDPPSPCSSVCDIAATAGAAICDDNGTPSDPNDDIFTVDITVAGTGSGWQANDPSNSSGTYGQTVTFGPFPINGGPVALTFSAIDDATCQDVAIIDPPLTCSNLCDIAATPGTAICDDNGTANNPNDDTFTVDITVTGTGSGWQANDPSNTSGTYGQTFTFGPFPISGGPVALTFSAQDDPTCQDIAIIDPPSPCSSVCDIAATAGAAICDDNGTPSDPNDDTFTVDITVTGTGSGWQSNDPSNSSGTYGSTFTFGPFPISGGPVALTFSAQDDPTCQDVAIIDPPATCSGGCELTFNFFDLACDDNGTPATSSDDTFTANLVITGINASNSWTAGTPANTSANYGDIVSIGPFSTLQSEVTFDVVDDVDASCLVEVIIPSTGGCSTGCPSTDTTFINNTACNPLDTGIQELILTNSIGCDSLVVTITSLLPSDTTLLSFASCNPQDTGVVETLLQNEFGCDSLVVSTTSLLPSDTTLLSFTSCNPQDTGVVETLLQNEFGCDSLVVSTTSLLPSDTTLLSFASCNPQDTGVVETLLQNEFGCDSLVVSTTSLLPSDTTLINLESCNPLDTGVVQSSLVNEFGCDSIVIISTILLPTDTTILSSSSCNPSDTGSVTTILINEFGCDSLVITNIDFALSDTTMLSFTSCNALDTGVVETLLQNEFGCDSLVISTTSLLPSDTTLLSFTSCNALDTGVVETLLQNEFGCDSLVISTTSLLPSDTTLLSFTSCNALDTGIVETLLQNEFGCDSLVISTTSLLPSDTTLLSFTSCNALDTGVVETLLQNTFGCDSLVISTTSLLPSDTTLLSFTSCNALDTGVVETLLQNEFGCDSLVISTTSLLPSDTTLLSFTSCNALDTGVVETLLQNEFGCDSLVISTTSLLPSDTTLLSFTSCNALDTGVVETLLQNTFGCDSLVISTTSLLPSDTTLLSFMSCNALDTGVVETFLQNTFGCDSLVISTTSLLPSDTTLLSFTSCNPQDTGVVETLLQNEFGCDSLVISTTSLLPSDTTLLSFTSCNALDTGVVETLLQNEFGCDSLVISTTSLLPSDTTLLSFTSCNALDTGVVETLLQNEFGCDSLVISTTSLLPSDTTLLSFTSCNALDTGVVETLLQNEFGCDSLVISTTSLLPSDTTLLSFTSCNAQDTGVVETLLQNEFGCDSLVISTTSLLEQSSTTLSPVVCPGDSLLINGVYYSADMPNGVDTLTAANGCDSLVFINLELLPDPVVQSIDTIVCSGEEVQIAGQIFNEASTTGQIAFQGQNGCDSLIVDVNVSFSDLIAQVAVISPLCEGLPGNITISEITGGVPPYSFDLEGVSNNLIDTFPLLISELFPGDYSITVEDDLGCSEMTEFSIQEGLIPFVDLGIDIEATVGDEIILNPIINFDYDTLMWEPGNAVSCKECLNPRVIATESVNIQLTAMSDDGCMASDNLLLLLSKDREVYAPNIFSPNGDGRNDFFTLFANPDRVEQIEELAIFDRWGNQVFENQDFPPNVELEGWDGTFRGEIMNSAVFVFYAQIRFSDGEVQLIEGDLTLMR